MRTLLSALALCLALAATSLAQDNTNQAVQDAYQKCTEARSAAREALREAGAKREAAGQGDKEAAAAFREATEPSRARQKAAEDEFRMAFEKSDWKSFGKEHEDLLREGLVMVGRHHVQTDPKRAIAAYEMLLEKFPESREAKSSVGSQLPAAYIAAGDLDLAARKVEEFMKAVDASTKLRLGVTQGDIYAAQGKRDRALEIYQALKDQAAASTSTDPNEKRALESAARNLDLRLALIGKPAPEIDSKNWLGGEAKPLSAHKGQVVVIDFWATWCGPCRAVMPALNELYKEHKGSMALLGVTRFYERGFMPEGDIRGPGESVQGMDEAAFQQHLAAFKERTKMEYPFVVGSKNDFENYKVTGIPTVVVVDAHGMVALVAVGSGSEPLIREAIKSGVATKEN